MVHVIKGFCNVWNTGYTELSHGVRASEVGHRSRTWGKDYADETPGPILTVCERLNVYLTLTSGLHQVLFKKELHCQIKKKKRTNNQKLYLITLFY